MANAYEEMMNTNPVTAPRKIVGCQCADSRRLRWLHAPNKDAEGWEYGVARVKFNEHGQVIAGPEWTRSDHSDIDALMAESPAEGAAPDDAGPRRGHRR